MKRRFAEARKRLHLTKAALRGWAIVYGVEVHGRLVTREPVLVMDCSIDAKELLKQYRKVGLLILQAEGRDSSDWKVRS